MMWSTLLFTCCFVMCGKRIQAQKLDEEFANDPDRNRNVSALLTTKGYPVEEHFVQTTDGYILTLHRIPYGRDGPSGAEKEVMILYHGFSLSGADFLINFPNQSLGFILADEGYDVWLVENRGNRYSRRHVTLQTDQTEFWDFSFDEMGKYDTPETIDYVLDYTGKEKLYCIGYSQGNTNVFALLSEKPEYNEKIKVLVAIAPITSIGFTTSSVRLIVPFAEAIAAIITSYTAGGLLIDSNTPENEEFFPQLKDRACIDTSTEFCEGLFYSLFGLDNKQYNQSRLAVVLNNLGTGTSVRTALHFAQLIRSKRFAKFDFGPVKNLEVYNQPIPPEYDLTRITAPVALVSSLNDIVANPTDVSLLRVKLKNLVYDYVVPAPYNHIHYVYGNDAYPVIYKQLLEFFKKDTYTKPPVVPFI